MREREKKKRERVFPLSKIMRLAWLEGEVNKSDAKINFKFFDESETCFSDEMKRDDVNWSKWIQASGKMKQTTNVSRAYLVSVEFSPLVYARY